MSKFIELNNYSQNYICCEKDLSFTKSVEASNFVLSKMYFSQHMNSGKCFALFEFNLSCIVQNILYVAKKIYHIQNQ